MRHVRERSNPREGEKRSVPQANSLAGCEAFATKNKERKFYLFIKRQENTTRKPEGIKKLKIDIETMRRGFDAWDRVMKKT